MIKVFQIKHNIDRIDDNRVLIINRNSTRGHIRFIRFANLKIGQILQNVGLVKGP